MIWVVVSFIEGIGEYSCCFFKTDTMVLPITRSLLIIPCKGLRFHGCTEALLLPRPQLVFAVRFWGITLGNVGKSATIIANLATEQSDVTDRHRIPKRHEHYEGDRFTGGPTDVYFGDIGVDTSSPHH